MEALGVRDVLGEGLREDQVELPDPLRHGPAMCIWSVRWPAGAFASSSALMSITV